MPQQTTMTLKALFSEVLANLAFMFADEEPDHGRPDGPWLETTVSYFGPASGTFRLQCPRSFAVLLASSMLATDVTDQDAVSKASDAVKEFMSILCGQCITAWHGTENAFHLTIPQIRELPGTPMTGRDENTTVFSVCNHGVQLCYTPGEAVPAL